MFSFPITDVVYIFSPCCCVRTLSHTLSETLVSILHTVRLEHLLERVSHDLGEERDWPQVLSPLPHQHTHLNLNFVRFSMNAAIQ